MDFIVKPEDEIEGKLFLDCCCTRHITNERLALSEYTPVSEQEIVNPIAENISIKIERYGKLKLI